MHFGYDDALILPGSSVHTVVLDRVNPWSEHDIAA